MANVSSSNGIEKYPKLRFPEFTEPWKTTHLCKLFKKNTQKNSASTVTNVICNSAKNGLIPQKDYFDKDIANADNTAGYYIISKNDFVYNPRKSADAPYGPISRYTYDEDGIVSPLYLCFRGTKNVNPEYFERYFRSAVWHRYIYMSGDSGARHDRVSIKDETFFEMPVKLPNDKEQDKIARFLSLIEKKIEVQAALVDDLKKYKRGVETILLEGEYFNKGNAIRTCLGDVCSFFSGGTPSSGNSSYYGGNIPFIRSGEIHSEHTELQLTELGLKNSAAKMVARGDLLLALYGATSGEVDISKIDGAINQAILCIRPDAINKIYLKHLLSYNKTNIINTYLQGGQGNLSAEIIKGLYFDIPDSHIQNEVSTILDTLDKRINYAESQKSTLDLLKKGLLQQLFI